MRRGRKGSFQIHWFSRRKHDGEQSFAGLFLVVHMPQAANQRGRFMTQFYCILAAGNDFQFWILIFLLVWQLITYDRSVSEGGGTTEIIHLARSFERQQSCHADITNSHFTMWPSPAERADRLTGRQSWRSTKDVKHDKTQAQNSSAYHFLFKGLIQR